ncbi:MAG: hypothetical protein IKA76_06540 [Clostridia bacterium]|nr:hypothetical protein [Clostridia bacterium]
MVPHEDLCDGNFVALHGYEVGLSKIHGEPGHVRMPVYHFNLIAKDPKNRIMPTCPATGEEQYEDPKEWFEHCARYDTEWLNRYIQAANEAGFLVNYNHPQWSLQSMEDYIGLHGLFGMEIINGGCLLYNDNTSIHMEAMLRHGTDILPVAGDDNHSALNCGNAFTMIKAEQLTYGALIHALEAGNFYVSEGPEILELSLENGRFTLRTDRPCTVVLLAESRHIRYAENTDRADLEFKPSSAGRYVRFEVRDAFGKKAFTRAYYTKDLI